MKILIVKIEELIYEGKFDRFKRWKTFYQH